MANARDEAFDRWWQEHHESVCAEGIHPSAVQTIAQVAWVASWRKAYEEKEKNPGSDIREINAEVVASGRARKLGLDIERVPGNKIQATGRGEFIETSSWGQMVEALENKVQRGEL